MKVDFIDLRRVNAPYLAEIQEAVARVVTSGRYIGGDAVRGFEEAFASYVGAEQAIGASSGTDALLVALMALGVGPGDEVVVPALTFVSPASCVARLGATPVFVDVDSYYGIDPDKLSGAITSRTRAIIVVHLYGQCASPEVIRIAKERGLVVIEDAAQAVGATHRGRHAGTMGDIGCFSFFPTKNLGAMGDGGMVVTHDSTLAEKVRLLCSHGAKPKYRHIALGGNFRLDPIQAAVLGVKLKHLDAINLARRENARAYGDALRVRRHVGSSDFEQLSVDLVAHSLPSTDHLRCKVLANLPAVREGNVHTFHQYCVLVSERDAVRTELAERGVNTMVYYPEALPRQPIFEGGASPVADRICDSILALPIYEALPKAERDYVIGVFNDVMRTRL